MKPSPSPSRRSSKFNLAIRTEKATIYIPKASFKLQLDPVNSSTKGNGKWFELTGVRINKVKTVLRHSKGNEYGFELAGTSNYRGPTVYRPRFQADKISKAKSLHCRACISRICDTNLNYSILESVVLVSRSKRHEKRYRKIVPSVNGLSA